MSFGPWRLGCRLGDQAWHETEDKGECDDDNTEPHGTPSEASNAASRRVESMLETRSSHDLIGSDDGHPTPLARRRPIYSSHSTITFLYFMDALDADSRQNAPDARR
jgi:hypothetical protein